VSCEVTDILIGRIAENPVESGLSHTSKPVLYTNIQVLGNRKYYTKNVKSA
jgi:hypothetical protein